MLVLAIHPGDPSIKRELRSPHEDGEMSTAYTPISPLGVPRRDSVMFLFFKQFRIFNKFLKFF
jgi:hypothetical protein